MLHLGSDLWMAPLYFSDRDVQELKKNKNIIKKKSSNNFEKYRSIVLTSNQFPSQHYIKVPCRQIQWQATKLYLTELSYLLVLLCPCIGITAKSVQKLAMICLIVALGCCVQRNGNNSHFHALQFWIYEWDTCVIIGSTYQTKESGCTS